MFVKDYHVAMFHSCLVLIIWYHVVIKIPFWKWAITSMLASLIIVNDNLNCHVALPPLAIAKGNMESLDVLSPPRIEGGNVECLDVLPLIETWGNLMSLDVLLPSGNLNNLGNLHYLWSICYYKSLCTSLDVVIKVFGNKYHLH